MFPPQSTPSKRPKRRVESYRIYKRPYSAFSQSSRPSPSSYEKATHGRLVGPTLSTPRGDKYYNQYRPLCEVRPRDRGKVVGTLQGFSGLSPPVKYFTNRSKRFFCGSSMFFLSCVCYAFVRVCLYVPRGHLLGKGWPLGSRLWCLTVSLLLSHWFPRSG